MENNETLREFVERILPKHSEIGMLKYFEIGRTTGHVGKRYPDSPFSFEITFDPETKRGRKTLREFADLFDQLEGVEWTTWNASISLGIGLIPSDGEGRHPGWTDEELDSKR